MATVTHSTLAEGLADVGAYYDSPSSGVVSEYCQDQFVIVITPGLSSEDQTGHSTYLPTTLSDYDGDNGTGGITEGKIQADSTLFDIPVNYNGSTWLDDVAYYMYTNDMVGYQTGFQNVSTYTVGFMGNRESNLFLINTSNNGNGYQKLYDTNDSHYGKFHFEAESPDGLATAILNAVNSILSRTSTFTAPVVPVTRTTSGNRIYMALFKPMEDNFWQGNVVKFGLSSANEIIDVDGNVATWPNGSIKASARPYWSTLNWSDADYASPVCTGDGCNYIDNSARNIYTYLGENTALTHSSNEFDTSNSFLTAAVMGQPTQGLNTIINFVRGADALDKDGDSDISENRSFITGDVLHSEPAVFQYKYIHLCLSST